MTRFLIVIAVLAAAPVAAEPRQLPKVCAADSPIAEPCTALRGRYRVELVPSAKSCVVRKPVSGILTITSEGRTPDFDASPLIKAIGLAMLPEVDRPKLTAAIREGVCCIDLRLYGHAGKKREQRLMVMVASGGDVAAAKADDTWLDVDGPGMCGDEPLGVKVTRLR